MPRSECGREQGDCRCQGPVHPCGEGDCLHADVAELGEN